MQILNWAFFQFPLSPDGGNGKARTFRKLEQEKQDEMNSEAIVLVKLGSS